MAEGPASPRDTKQTGNPAPLVKTTDLPWGENPEASVATEAGSPAAGEPDAIGASSPPGSAGAIDVGVAAEVIRRVNRTRQVVSLVSQGIIRAYDEEALHGEVCRFLVTFGGYLMAWVGLGDDKRGNLVRPVAHAGLEPNFLEALEINWSKDLEVRSPTMTAMLEQRPVVARHIATDPRLARLQAKARLLGYTATCAVPLQFAGHGTGVLTIHSTEPDAFGSEEVALLRELANDLAAGVIGLRERAKRQVLEEETRRAETRYRAIIRNAHEGIFEATEDGSLVMVNDALASLLGYQNPEAMLSAKPAVIATHVHAQDYDSLIASPQGRDHAVEVRMRAKGGSWIWVAIGLMALETTTGHSRVGFVKDLTAIRQKREANARLASVVDAADEAIIGTDLRGAVTDWNKGATRLFGYRRTEVLGRPIAEFLVPADRKGENVRVFDAIGRGEAVPRFETVRSCKEDKLIHTSVAVNPIFAHGTEVVGATIVEHDITKAHLSAASKRLQELQEAEVTKLKGMEKMRKTFISEASHELNTPLTPLRIHVDALLGAPELSAEHREHMVVIERNVLRVCNLVRDMLEASRLETGRFRLKASNISVAHLIADVMRGLREAATRKGVQLETGPETRLVAHADPDRMGQVLYNLVSNAIDFTPAGGRVTADAAIGDDDRVVVQVRDTGVGLTSEQISQLFQPFSRPHERAGSGPKGTGLGLFISKGIVEQHGGRIWAESHGLGKGSSFCFTMDVGRTKLRGPGRGRHAASTRARSSQAASEHAPIDRTSGPSSVQPGPNKARV